MNFCLLYFSCVEFEESMEEFIEVYFSDSSDSDSSFDEETESEFEVSTDDDDDNDDIVETPDDEAVVNSNEPRRKVRTRGGIGRKGGVRMRGGLQRGEWNFYYVSTFYAVSVENLLNLFFSFLIHSINFGYRYF